MKLFKSSQQLYIRVFIILSIFYMVKSGKTKVTIKGEDFYINNQITYPLTPQQTVEGLLFNSRMIQGVFDDYNTSTANLWAYPDTKKWDPMRNTQEFVGNMSLWKGHQMLSFSVGLQGGCPYGYCHGPQTWIVSAFDFETGQLDEKYMQRLSMILKEADDIGMVPIVQFYYGAQAHRFKSNEVIINATRYITNWLTHTGYNNILIDVSNECNGMTNNIQPLSPSGSLVDTIKMIQDMSNRQLFVGTSFNANGIPTEQIVNQSDIVFIHTSGDNTTIMQQHINIIRNYESFKQNPKPILVTEDSNGDFNSSSSHIAVAVNNHVSFGYFGACPGNEASDYKDGYQCPPIAWNINTNSKAAFFERIEQYAIG
eukprot:421011_1